MFDPVICVPPDQIDAAWPLVKGLLRSGYAACDELMPEHLREWLKADSGQLWVFVHGGRVLAAMITSLELRPSGKVCRLGAVGGMDLDQWREYEPRIVEYARAEGCVKLVTEGRPGWQRVLPGYSIVRVQLEKVL